MTSQNYQLSTAIVLTYFKRIHLHLSICIELYVFKMVVQCELYLCNINRLDIPEEVHLIWISQSTEYNNICIHCQDRPGFEPTTCRCWVPRSTTDLIWLIKCVVWWGPMLRPRSSLLYMHSTIVLYLIVIIDNNAFTQSSFK